MIHSLYIATALLLAATNVFASTSASNAHQEARDLALRQLPEAVRRDLESRSPDEYELNYEHLLDRSLFARGDASKAKGNEEVCKDGHSIAMTYDDGPYSWNKELADKYHVAGHNITYFVNVNNWDCSYNAPYPEDLQHAMSLGHVIGSHSATHPDFQTLTWKQIDQQISLVEQFTHDTLGVIPRFFRPPYGSTNDSINAYLQKRWGLTVVTWNVDSGDSVGATVPESIANITQARPGSIILNHETYNTSAREVADAAIKHFDDEHIKTVNVQRCLNLSPYKTKLKTFPKRNDSWDCKKRNIPEPGKSSV